MLALRSMDMTHPMLLEGISWISEPELLTGVDGFRAVAWSADEQYLFYTVPDAMWLPEIAQGRKPKLKGNGWIFRMRRSSKA